MQYDPIQGQGHEPLKVGKSAIFKGYLLPQLSWGQYLKLIGSGFLNFVPVCVSRDFEVGSK